MNQPSLVIMRPFVPAAQSSKQISRRRLDVLARIHKSDKDIAHELGIAVSTVRTHIDWLMNFTGMRRAELAAWFASGEKAA